MSTLRLTRAAMLLALFIALPGCLLAAVGVGAGVVAAVGEDTAQVDLRAEPAAVYDAAVSRIENGGAVTSSDAGRMILEGELENSKITVSVFRVGEFTRVSVKARQVGGAFPDLDLAKRIATDITRSF